MIAGDALPSLPAWSRAMGPKTATWRSRGGPEGCSNWAEFVASQMGELPALPVGREAMGDGSSRGERRPAADP